MSSKEIEQKAIEVNRISLNYHLTHAIFACNELLREDYKKEHKAELTKLGKELQEAYRSENVEKQTDVRKTIKHTEQKVKYYIYVEYVPMPADENRVVKTERQLIVSLSKELLESARDKDDSFSADPLKKLRHATAHELGHALLHSEEIKLGATQGSKELGSAAETEAELFANKLLTLRSDRNEKLYKSGAY
jgi:hypothetical protein